MRSVRSAGVILTFSIVALGIAPGIPPAAAEAPTITITTDIETTGARAPVTFDDLIEQFARDYEAAVNGRRAAAIAASVDLDRMLARALDGREVPEPVRRGFADGLRSTFDWSEAMLQAVGTSGQIRLLRIRNIGGRPRALFRVITDAGGLNYHEVHLDADDAGAICIVDIYVHLTGETMSATLGRSFEQSLVWQSGTRDAVADELRIWRDMSVAVRSGRFEDVVDLYRAAPASLRSEKLALIWCITSAARIGHSIIDEACAEFRRLFPDDPCVDLLTIDQLFMQQRWSDAVTAIDRIRRVVGDDPYLDDLTANIHLSAGHLDAARARARDAIAREPSLEPPYWTLVDVALVEENYAAVAHTLGMLEDRFQLRFPDLGATPAFSGFVASTDYERWRTRDRARAMAGDDRP